MKGPVIHPFFIPSGSYCVFPCQEIVTVLQLKMGEQVTEGLHREATAALPLQRLPGQGHNTTDCKNPPPLKLHVLVYPKTMKP